MSGFIKDHLGYLNISSVFFSEFDFLLDPGQYFRVYDKRLTFLKGKLQQKLHVDWPKIQLNSSIPKCKDKNLSICIGVLYKDMPLRPNPLSPNYQQQLVCSSFLSSSVKENLKKHDNLYLEDKHGKILLDLSKIRNLHVDDFFSGIVIAVKGKYDIHEGHFIVSDIMLPYSHIVNVISPDNLLISNQNFTPNIAIIGGIYHGISPLFKTKEECDHYEAVKNKLSSNLKKITSLDKLIISGGLINVFNDLDNFQDDKESNRISNNKIKIKLIDEIARADSFINTLAKDILVEIMPSEKEPTTALFPQMPFNKRLFKASKNNSNVQFVSNPYKFMKGNNTIFGFSQEILSSIKKYSNKTNDIDIIVEFIQSGHLAPIIPDMIRSYPFKDTDPFLITKEDDIPEVIFYSGGDKYERREILFNKKKLTLLIIPEFYKTNSIILLNTETYEAAEYIIN